MGLQSAHAVDDLRAGPEQVLRTLQIARLVEAGLEFHQDGDVLPGLRGLDERGDDPAVLRGAVEDLLDGDHVLVRGRLLHQLQHRLEGIVGMVQQQVASRE